MKRKRKPEQEIDFELKDGVMRTVMRPKRKVTHTFHTSNRFMDYLHGDVEDGEAEVACLYEYARESQTMWEAAGKRDEFKTTGDSGHAAWAAWAKVNLSKLMAASRSQPRFSWTAFSEEGLWNDGARRSAKKSRGFSQPPKIQPLRMLDLVSLDASGVLDKFKILAVNAKPAIQELRPGEKGAASKVRPSILQQHEIPASCDFHPRFSQNGGATAHRVSQAWLRLPGNKKLLAQHKMPKTLNHRNTLGPSERPSRVATLPRNSTTTLMPRTGSRTTTGSFLR